MIKCPRCGGDKFRTLKNPNGFGYHVYCCTCGKWIDTMSAKQMRENHIEFIQPITRSYLEKQSDKAINRMVFFEDNAGNDKKAICYSYYKGRRDAYEDLIKYLEGDAE